MFLYLYWGELLLALRPQCQILLSLLILSLHYINVIIEFLCMNKENRQVFKRAMFIGADGHMFGTAEINSKNEIFVKRLGDFGKPVPAIRIKEGNKFFYIDSPEQDPRTGDFTGNSTRIFFFSLFTGDTFSFNKSSPAQLMLSHQTLQTENRELKNSFQKIMRLLDATSIDDYNKKMIQDEVERARKLTTYAPNPMMGQQGK